MDFPFSQIPDIVLKKLPRSRQPANTTKAGRKRAPKIVEHSAIIVKDHDITNRSTTPPLPGDEFEYQDHDCLPTKRVSFDSKSNKFHETKKEPEIVNFSDEDSALGRVQQDPEEQYKPTTTTTTPVEETGKTSKTFSDAIIQADLMPKVELVDKSTQTKEDRDYEDYKAQLQAHSLSGNLPIFPLSDPRNSKLPPLKIGLSRPKGRPRKRKVFYPDEEPYYRPSAPAC